MCSLAALPNNQESTTGHSIPQRVRHLWLGLRYVDLGQASYEARYQARVLANLTRRAKQLGYALVKNPETALGVS